jgi:hypothetical protein
MANDRLRMGFSTATLGGTGKFMRYLAAILLGLICSSSFASPQPADSARPPALKCEVGPLHETYGKTEWLVYACSDARSVVIVSAEGSPAAPFYFIFYIRPDGTMKLYGEGNGKKSATQPAFDELKRLSQSDVAALVAQAQSLQATKVRDGLNKSFLNGRPDVIEDIRRFHP